VSSEIYPLFWFKKLISAAKHLEPLKGGKIPLETLVRGKDPEQNEKLFVKITDIIKSAGVSHNSKVKLVDS
jgi:hypothetical protein